jgi:hypothetical protein
MGGFFFPHRSLFVLGLNALVFFRRTVLVSVLQIVVSVLQKKSSHCTL